MIERDTTDPAIVELAERASEVGRGGDADAARLLLGDVLAHIAAADRLASVPIGVTPGVETASRWAAAAHAADQDDIVWDQGVHPGSIVWPVVLATVVGGDDSRRPSGEAVLAAACIGYQVLVDVAAMIGSDARLHWHATGVAGTLAAAATAAVLTGHPPDDQVFADALGLAATSAIGVAQTMLEHSPAGRFHRAAAVATGWLAASHAVAGLRAPARVLSGERGLLVALGADPLPQARILDTAIARTAVRVFPGNGFAQAPMRVAARAGEEHDLDECVIGVHAATVALSTADGGWWDTAALCEEALRRRDPWLRAAAVDVQRPVPPVRLAGVDVPFGCAVRLGADGRPAGDVVTPPGRAVLWASELETKWEMLGCDPSAVLADASAVLTGHAPGHLGDLLQRA